MFCVSARLRHRRRLWAWAAFVHVDIWVKLATTTTTTTHPLRLTVTVTCTVEDVMYIRSSFASLSVWLTECLLVLVDFRKRKSSDCIWRDGGHSCSFLIYVVMLRCGAVRGDWSCSEGKITDKRAADWRISAFGSSKKLLCLFPMKSFQVHFFVSSWHFSLYIF